MYDTFTVEELEEHELGLLDVPAYDYDTQVWTTADHVHLRCDQEDPAPLYCGCLLDGCPGEPEVW